MKLLLTLLGLCFSLTILADDLSIRTYFIEENQQLRAGYHHRLSASVRREDDDTNSILYAIYYRWNNGPTNRFSQGIFKTSITSFSRNIMVPNLIGESAILYVWVASNSDTFKMNDTVKIRCFINERYPKDLKISLLKPSEQSNLRTGISHQFQFKIINEGSETFTQGSTISIWSWFDTTRLFKEKVYTEYKGHDVKTGDTTMYYYPVTIPEYADLTTSNLCIIMNWVEDEEGSNFPVNAEDDGYENRMCRTINTIALDRNDPMADNQPWINFKNQQLSFASEAHILSYNKIQVFNLSGKLLMMSAISDNRQTWNLPVNESVVVVVVSGPKESHRELIVAQ